MLTKNTQALSTLLTRRVTSLHEGKMVFRKNYMQTNSHGCIQYKDENVVDGLDLIPNYLSQEEHDIIQNEIVSMFNFSTPQQHPIYKRRIVNLYPDSMIRNRMPFTFEQISKVFKKFKLLDVHPNAIQINEYDPDGGCPPHTDAKSIGPVIGMFSFCSSCVMDLIPTGTTDKDAQLLLDPRSLLILKGTARYNYEHGIVPSLQHHFKGNTIQKDKRYSLVFWRTLNSSQSTMATKQEQQVTNDDDTENSRRRIRLV